MIRKCVKITAYIAASAALIGCANRALNNPNSTGPNFQPFPGQGQYIRPAYLDPEPSRRLPPDDLCRSRLYLTLLGQHEGAIFLAGLPGRKRIVKPAELEGFDDDVKNFVPPPPLVEVIDYLPDQTIYAGSIRTIMDRFLLTNEDETRLTLELDTEGYVQNISCG